MMLFDSLRQSQLKRLIKICSIFKHLYLNFFKNRTYFEYLRIRAPHTLTWDECS